MGVDGISLPFVILTTALMPICILASWVSIQTRVKEYMIAFLVLETLMVGTFSALDLVLFYLFFEGGLIPMFLIIGVWGGPRRVYASFKFFLYTLLGSVLMLLAIMAMYWQAGTTDIPTLLQHGFPLGLQKWAWFAFFASFAVKMPMWPVHTWLPDAHVEAPTAGSVILAAILLKMGGYGFLRFSLPMFPEASHDVRAAGVHALGRRHHLHLAGGADAGGREEADRLFVRRAHGLRHHGHFRGDHAGRCRRHLPDDLARHRLRRAVPLRRRRLRPACIRARSPPMAGWSTACRSTPSSSWCSRMANVGLPGTSGFVGEFLALIGTFKANIQVAFVATLGVILSAAYALWLYRKMIFGTLKPGLEFMKDIGLREAVIFTPLVVLTILFGVAPKPVLDMSAASVAQLLDGYNKAITARKTAEAAPVGVTVGTPR